MEFCLVLILSGVDAHITIETYESCQPIECKMVKPDLTKCECERWTKELAISKTRSPMTNQPLLIANVANCQLEEQDSRYLWLLIGKSDCWQRLIAPPGFLLILPSCIYPWNLSCATTKVCPRLQETIKFVLVQNKTRSHYTTACAAAISRELANYSHFTHQTLSLPLWPEPRVNMH